MNYVESNVAGPEFIIDDINDLKKNDFDFNIYPNPNNGLFTIIMMSTNNNKQWQVNILNVLGENVLQQNFNDAKNKTLDLRNIAAGVYFVRLNDGKNIVQKRVVISK